MRTIAVVSLLVSLVGFGCGGDDGGDEPADDDVMIDASTLMPDGVIDPEPFKVPVVHPGGTITYITLPR